MNREAAEDLSLIIRRLSEDLSSNHFEKELLHSFSSLFDPRRIAYVRRQGNDSGGGVYVAEFSEGVDRAEMMLETDFSERYGFKISDAVAAETSLVKGLSDDAARVVISFQTGDYHSLILMTDVKNTVYLLDEHLTLINSLIEVILNARYAIKEVMKTGDRELERVISSSHKVQGSLSSVRMAIEMLLEQDLSAEDRDHLKRLAYKGMAEVKARIHEGVSESILKSDVQD